MTNGVGFCPQMLFSAGLAAPVWLAVGYTALILLLSPVLLVAATALAPRLPLIALQRIGSIPVESI
jgi:hypothetical protein